MKGMEREEEFTLLPSGRNHNCFGCSPKNEHGLQMEFHLNEKKDAVVSWLSVPEHFCGWGNIAHGGIISTMLDEAMGWAALVLLGKLALTKTISVEFCSPVFIGKQLRIEGSVQNIGSEREAVMQGVVYDGKLVCAKSSSVCSLFTIEFMKKMDVVDEGMLTELEALMEKYKILK